MEDENYWILMAFLPVVCLAPGFAFAYIKRTYFYSPMDLVSSLSSYVWWDSFRHLWFCFFCLGSLPRFEREILGGAGTVGRRMISSLLSVAVLGSQLKVQVSHFSSVTSPKPVAVVCDYAMWPLFEFHGIQVQVDSLIRMLCTRFRIRH